jgi:hypothetical protein
MPLLDLVRRLATSAPQPERHVKQAPPPAEVYSRKRSLETTVAIQARKLTRIVQIYEGGTEGLAAKVCLTSFAADESRKNDIRAVHYEDEDGNVAMATIAADPRRTSRRLIRRGLVSYVDGQRNKLLGWVCLVIWFIDCWCYVFMRLALSVFVCLAVRAFVRLFGWISEKSNCHLIHSSVMDDTSVWVQGAPRLDQDKVSCL